MIGSAQPPRALDWRDAESQHAFLRSQRAKATCTREVQRVAEGVVAGATRLAQAHGLAIPTTKPSPDRIMVQLGPVAVSLAWLKGGGSDAPVGGELLAIVWKGALAARGGAFTPERVAAPVRTIAPVTVWEEALTPSATTPEDWHWHAHGLESAGHTSDEVAARCVAALRSALESALGPAAVAS